MISRATALASAMSLPDVDPQPLVGPLGGRGAPGSTTNIRAPWWIAFSTWWKKIG